MPGFIGNLSRYYNVNYNIKNSRAIMKASIFIVPFILFGCAVTQTPKIPESIRVETDALIIGTLISNTSFISVGIDKLNVIEVKNLATKKKYLISPGQMKYLFANTISLIGWLPEGKYSVESFEGHSYPFSASFNVEKFDYEFDVKAGEIYNMNTLIYQPTGDGSATIVQVPSTPAVDFLQASMGSASDVLTNRPINEIIFSNTFPLRTSSVSSGAPSQGLIVSAMTSMSTSASHIGKKTQWSSVSSEGELFKLIRNSTTALNGKAVLPDGRWIFGSKLGQILVRDNSGVWSTVDTGTDCEILAVAFFSGKIIAAIDDGKLLIGDSNLQNWVEAPLLVNEGAVIAIEKISLSKLALVVRTATDLKVHIIENPEIELPAPSISMPISRIYEFGIMAAPRGIFDNIGGKLWLKKNNKLVYVYDPHIGAWTERKTKHSFFKLSASDDSSVAVMIGAAGIFGTHVISSDGGVSFNKLNAPSIIADLHFIDRDKGYGLVPDMHVFSASNHMIATVNGGKTWSAGKELPDPCVDWHVVDKKALCVTKSGSIISSENATDIVTERLIQ